MELGCQYDSSTENVSFLQNGVADGIAYILGMHRYRNKDGSCAISMNLIDHNAWFSTAQLAPRFHSLPFGKNWSRLCVLPRKATAMYACRRSYRKAANKAETSTHTTGCLTMRRDEGGLRIAKEGALTVIPSP